jgi:glycosyltransferase involved in cell wall biosynthesis
VSVKCPTPTFRNPIWMFATFATTLATLELVRTLPETTSPPDATGVEIEIARIFGGAFGGSIGTASGGGFGVGAGRGVATCAGVGAPEAGGSGPGLCAGVEVTGGAGFTAGAAVTGAGAVARCDAVRRLVPEPVLQPTAVASTASAANMTGRFIGLQEIADVTRTIPALREGYTLCPRRTVPLMQTPQAAAVDISVVVPLYNEEGNVAALVERIESILRTLPDAPSCEIVLVNDGSTDGTLASIRHEMRTRPNIVLVNLSRNFGHQLAATAGLDVAAGSAVILMDGDLQDPPELIAQFVERWRQGYDVVYAVRRTRKGESTFKLLTAQIFYRMIKRMTNVSIPVDTGDFRLMDRRVVNVLKAARERHRFLRGMVSWAGFDQTGVEYDREERLSGRTKYPVSKMLRFAIDGITSFSDVPLRFASYLGFTVSTAAFIYAIVIVIFKAFHLGTPEYARGWASTMVVILFLGGVQLIGIGILGEYLGRIYDEVKARPLYLIADIERSAQSTS